MPGLHRQAGEAKRVAGEARWFVGLFSSVF